MFFRFRLVLLILQSTFIIKGEEISNNSTNNKQRWNYLRRYRTTTATSVTIIKSFEENSFSATTSLPLTFNVSKTIAVAPATITTTTINPIVKTFLESNIDCGNLATENIPWIAVIEHKDPDNPNSRKTLSKGVLISDRHVLTTVSSIYNSNPFWIVSGIRLGDPSTWFNSNNLNKTYSVQTIGIDQIYQHENKDIAVIKMASNVNFTETIQPICLSLGENYNFRESYMHVCKKTIGENGRTEKYSELVPVYTLSPQDCVMMYNRKGAKISDKEFCAWDQYGDNCLGDIGGPLMSKYSEKYLVVGLNSFAITDDENDIDLSDYPGVYVNVGSHLEWIKKIIDEK